MMVEISVLETFSDLINKFNRAVDKIENITTSTSNGNVSNINLKTDRNWGMWITTTCCAVSLTVTLLMAIQVHDMSRKYDRMQDYLNAIYMTAPHLKPKELK